MHFERVTALTEDDLIPVKDNRKGNSGDDRWISPFYLGANLVGQMPTDKVLWVSEGGNDATALRGRMDKPFRNLLSARSAAFSGDTIYVLPGSYTLTGANDQLLKDGVNWHGMVGARISKVITSSSDPTGIFDDRNIGAVTSRITGAFDLVFQRTSGGSAHDACIHTNNANTTLYIEVNSISITTYETLGPSMCAIRTWQCKLTQLKCRNIFDPSKETSSAHGILWYQGEAYYQVERIVVGGVGVYFIPTIADDISEAFANVDYIEGGRHLLTSALLFDGGSVAAPLRRGWVFAKDIVCPTNNPAVWAANQSGKYYLFAQKAGVGASGGVPVDISGGVNLWLQIEKITGFGGAGINVAAGYTGVAKIRTQEIEDLGGMTSQVSVAGGTLHLNGGGVMKALNGKGVVHSGGTSFIRNFRIDTSNTNGATNRPVEISAAGCTIEGCSLVAPALADSIFAGSALVIKNIGSVANRAKNGSVTVNDGAVEQLGVWSGYA